MDNTLDKQLLNVNMALRRVTDKRITVTMLDNGKFEINLTNVYHYLIPGGRYVERVLISDCTVNEAYAYLTGIRDSISMLGMGEKA